LDILLLLLPPCSWTTSQQSLSPRILNTMGGWSTWISGGFGWGTLWTLGLSSLSSSPQRTWQLIFWPSPWQGLMLRSVGALWVWDPSPPCDISSWGSVEVVTLCHMIFPSISDITCFWHIPCFQKVTWHDYISHQNFLFRRLYHYYVIFPYLVNCLIW